MLTKTVTLLTLDYPPIHGGISRYLYSLVQHWPPASLHIVALPADGFELFDHSQPHTTTRLNVPRRWQPFHMHLKLLAPFYLWHLLRRPSQLGDVILCGQAHYAILLPAFLIARLRGRRFGIVAHGLDILFPQTQRYGPLFNKLLHAADLLIANTQNTAAALAQLGIPQHKIHIIYPCVSPTEPASAAVNLRQKHGLADKRIILTLSRLVERKGHDMVIRSLPTVLEQIPDAHYLIVGKGQYEAALRALAEAVGVAQHVTFAGFAPDDLLHHYYALADLYIMASREIPERGDVEGFGIVYLEAGQQGKPVIAGNSGGVAEAVADGVNGLLVDPADSAEIAAAIIRLLTDTDLAHKLGENGRVLAASKFNCAQAAATLAAIINRL